MKSMESRSRLIREGGWAALAQVMSALGALAGVRALTEFAPPETYGSITLLLGAFTVVQGTLINPIMQASLRLYPEYAESRLALFRKTLVSMLWRRILIVLATLALSWPIINHFKVSSLGVVVLMALLFVLEGFRNLETVLLNAARRQRAYSLITIFEAWGRPLLAIAAILLWESSVESVFAGYAIATSLTLILIYLLVQPEGRISTGKTKLAVCPTLRHAVARYSLPLAPLAIMDSVSGVGDRYILAALLGVDKAGVYAATYGLLSRPFLMMAGTFDLSVRPVYYQSVAAGNHDHAHKILRRWLVLIILISGAGFVLSFLLKDFIVEIFLAREYWVGANLIPWIAGGYSLLVISNVFEKVCYAYGFTGRILAVRSIAAVSGLLIAYYGIVLWGMPGAAIAVPIYFGLQMVMNMIVAGASSSEQGVQSLQTRNDGQDDRRLMTVSK
jgi:O-antigen/teichoic acid export membrane protein